MLHYPQFLPKLAQQGPYRPPGRGLVHSAVAALRTEFDRVPRLDEELLGLSLELDRAARDIERVVDSGSS